MFITEDKNENIATLWGSIEDMQKIICLMSYVVNDDSIAQALQEARELSNSNLHPDDCESILRQFVEFTEIKDHSNISVQVAFEVVE